MPVAPTPVTAVGAPDGVVRLVDPWACLARSAPGDLKLAGTMVLRLDLPSAAHAAEARLDTLFTPAERAEIAAAGSEKRRCEKLAGKLAGKLLAREAVRRWLSVDCREDAIEVRSRGGPPRLAAPGDHALDGFLAGLFISIAHTSDVACGAVARRPVGIDVERMRALADATATAICGDRLGSSASRELLPIVVFTQKEAVLKAAGVGLSKGLSDVHIDTPQTSGPVETVHRGSRYQVVTSIAGELVFSLALRLPYFPRLSRSASTSPAWDLGSTLE